MSFFNHIHGNHPHAAGDASPYGISHGIGMGRTAHLYDALGHVWFMGQESAFRRKTIDLVAIQPGESVLEVGCGTGTLTLLAQQKAGPTGQATGIDLAPEMVAVAREKAARRGSPARFQAGIIQEIPFPDASYDAVIASLMVHHLPDEAARRQGLAEVLRVLKPGGRFTIVEFQPPTGGLARFFYGLIIGRRMLGIDNASLTGMLTEAGFTQVKSGVLGPSIFIYVTARKESPHG